MMITRVTKIVILSIRTASQSADFCKQISTKTVAKINREKQSISATTYVLHNRQDHLKVRQPCRNYCDYKSVDSYQKVFY